jgi:hypothetical protein
MIDELPVPEEVVVALDGHVAKLKKLAEASDNVKFWKAEHERLKGELDKIMGDATVGTVDGAQVLTYRYEERFRGSDFQKKYPDTYRSFVTEVTQKKFDLDGFKRVRPDLYEEFRVRAMKNSYETS